MDGTMKQLHRILTRPLACLVTLLLLPVAEAQFFPGNQSPGRPDHADVKYGPHERDVLDIWLAKTESPRPVIIVVHGGGFAVGDKKMGLRSINASEFLKNGVTVVSINHPFKTQIPWPDVFHHAARSIQHLRHHAKKYNIDKERIAVAGTSSGGGISSWLAFHDDLKDPDAKDPVLRESTKPLCAAILTSQSTYDQLRWPEILDMEKSIVEKVRGPKDLAAALFIDESELFKKKGIQMRAEIDIISMIDPSDPPVFVQNIGANVVPGDIVHHPRHSIALKKKCDEHGVKCELQLRGALGMPNSGATDFLLKHLTKR
jgi:acetyl esterase/lipase